MAKINRTSRRKKVTPEQRKKKRIIQITSGLAVFSFLIYLAIQAQIVNPNGAFIVMVGTAFGYVLQRSRFCFTAAARDPLLTGGTDLTKAVLIAFAVSSILFFGINVAEFGFDSAAVDFKGMAGNIKPVGLHTVIGGTLFGIGAVLAGGCASGTLMRMGEGFMQQWLSIIFFIIGSMIGVWALKAYKQTELYNSDAIFLPQALGSWVAALILQFGMIFILYLLADWWGKKKARGQ